MVRIVTMYFPMTSMNETKERFASLPKPPDFISIKGPWVSGKAEERIKTATLFEFDKSDQDQASEYLKTRYNTFLGVPEISIEIEEWVEVEEALEVLE